MIMICFSSCMSCTYDTMRSIRHHFTRNEGCSIKQLCVAICAVLGAALERHGGFNGSDFGIRWIQLMCDLWLDSVYLDLYLSVYL